MRAVLKSINFRHLWIAQIVLSLGDGLMQMGFLEFFRIHHYDKRVETAKLLFALSLPGVLLGPVAMAYLGRWQRRTVLITSDVIRAVLVVGIVVWLLPYLRDGAERPSLLFVYVMVGLIGVIATFYLPARSAIIPNLTDPEHLLKANTLFATSLAIMSIGGRALGGFVAEKFGVSLAVSANVVACIMATILMGLMKMDPHATTGDSPELKQGGWSEFKTGILYLWKHPTASPLVLLSAAFAFLLGILMVVFVGYASDTLGLRTGGLGYLAAAGGAGAAIGIGLVASGKSWTKSDWMPFIQLLLAAGSLVLLSFTTKVWVAALIVVALGAIGATVMIYIDAKLQAQVEDVRRGAVFAARGILTSLTMVVAFWLQFGTRLFVETPATTVMFWLGLSTSVAALLVLLLARRKKAGG